MTASYVAEETHRSLGDEFSVDSVQEDAGETDDAANQHRGVHLRLRRLYYATNTTWECELVRGDSPEKKTIQFDSIRHSQLAYVS